MLTLVCREEDRPAAEAALGKPSQVTVSEWHSHHQILTIAWDTGVLPGLPFFCFGKLTEPGDSERNRRSWRVCSNGLRMQIIALRPQPISPEIGDGSPVQDDVLSLELALLSGHEYESAVLELALSGHEYESAVLSEEEYERAVAEVRQKLLGHQHRNGSEYYLEMICKSEDRERAVRACGRAVGCPPAKTSDVAPGVVKLEWDLSFIDPGSPCITTFASGLVCYGALILEDRKGGSYSIWFCGDNSGLTTYTEIFDCSTNWSDEDRCLYTYFMPRYRHVRALLPRHEGFPRLEELEQKQAAGQRDAGCEPETI